MITKYLLVLALGFGCTAQAATNELVQNGSFESGTNNWILHGGAQKYTLTNSAWDGTNALWITNRANFTNAPRQDVTVALAAAMGVSNWTTRFAVSVTAPTVVRARLEVVTDTGTGAQTNRHLLAERVVRLTNQWTQLTGTKTVNWSGTLLGATFYTEIGMRQEPMAYPDCLLDDFHVRPDTDADGLWDEEEVAVALGGTGTDPLLKDSDGDGLPDGWEVAQGLDPKLASGSNDVFLDSDEDGFTNWEEFWGDTQPTNAISFPGKPGHSNLTESARAVLTYLARLPSQITNRVIAGQHLSDTEPEWAKHIVGLHTQTGYWPGLVSFAAEAGSGPLQITNVVPRALETWTNGGLVVIKWAMQNPWNNLMAGATNPSGVNIPELLNPDTVLVTNQVARSNYLAWRSVVADNLTILRDAGVVVLWRPCSEMNGAWFWWGNRPRDHYIALWRDLHDYFTNDRGLTNLLWVYEPDSSVHLVLGGNTSGTPIDYYYPGDDVTDVVGHNFYDNDWVLNYDSDAVWRGYGKIFAVPQAGSDDERGGTWDNLNYLNGVTNTIPRLAFFCAWNTFTTKGGTVTNVNAITDNPHPLELITNSLVVTRDEINWQYELPMLLDVKSLVPGTLQIEWQGGILQQSDDLSNWTTVVNAPRPLLDKGTNWPMGYWRLRK